MAVFGGVSALGLVLGPLLWLRWVPGASPESWSLRLAGATVAGLVGWSLGHRLWTDTLAAWCA
jgi:hypothetical protein